MIYVVGCYFAWVICGYYAIKVISGGEITTVMRKLCSEIENPYIGIFCFVLTCTLWVFVILLVLLCWLARVRQFNRKDDNEKNE